MHYDEKTGQLWSCGNIISSFEVLVEMGGWYECQKDSQGNRISPLVGYTKRDEFNRQLVGEEYVNFAKIEENVNAVHAFALLLKSKIPKNLLNYCDIFCGIPEGGKTLAAMLAFVCGKKFIYPDKKLIPSKILGERDESVFIFGRHKINKDDQVILVDDVVNNFTSSVKLCKMISDAGAHVNAIVSFFNRSIDIDDWFLTGVSGSCIGGDCVRVISLIRRQIFQYHQDNSFVSEYVKEGNIIWDPKNNWDQLIPWSC